MHEEGYIGYKSAQRQRIYLYGIIASVVVIIAVTAFFLIKTFQAPVALAPESIATQLSFPVYLPATLPGTYKVQDSSFAADNDVLIFKAVDKSGLAMVFSEQKQPPGFDFDTFYSTDLKGSKAVTDVPFSTVVGEAQQGEGQVLSIATGKTWVLITTPVAIGNADLQHIIRSLREQ